MIKNCHERTPATMGLKLASTERIQVKNYEVEVDVEVAATY
jgi:hypothetical protein